MARGEEGCKEISRSDVNDNVKDNDDDNDNVNYDDNP